MHSMAIELNGERIATIGLAGMDVIDVSVHGALDHEQKAVLDAMGGNYGEGGCGHLIWVEERSVLPGDIVKVSLLEHADRTDRGKTIAEFYPDEAPSTQTDFSISDAMAAELRARPRLHEGFIVQAETSSGQRATAASDARHTDFTFGLLWNRFNPDRARLRMSTYCLDDVLARTGGTEHLQTTLSFGEHASFSLLR